MASGTLVQRGKQGIWHMVVADPATGRQVWRTTGTSRRREAERALLDWQHCLGTTQTAIAPYADTTLGHFVNEMWLPQRAAIRKESTLNQYGSVARSLVAFLGARCTLRRAMTLGRLQSYVAAMVAKGRKPATIGLHLAVASSIARYAAECGYLDNNPVGRVQRPQGCQVRPLAYSAAEVARIVAATPTEHRDLVTCLFLSGCRRSEAAALTVGSCRLRPGLGTTAASHTPSISFERRVWRGSIGSPKTGPRVVPIGDILATILAERCASLGEGDLVFPGKAGGYINWDAWTRDVWIPTLRRAGVAASTPHATRRTSATLGLTCGIAPQVVAQRHGMSVQVLMKHYAAVLDEAAIAAADAIEDAILAHSGQSAAAPRGGRRIA